MLIFLVGSFLVLLLFSSLSLSLSYLLLLCYSFFSSFFFIFTTYSLLLYTYLVIYYMLLRLLDKVTPYPPTYQKDTWISKSFSLVLRSIMLPRLLRQVHVIALRYLGRDRLEYNTLPHEHGKLVLRRSYRS